MKRTSSKRSASNQIEDLLAGQELIDRVNRGLAHLKRVGLENAVGVCEESASSENDPEYFKRLKIKGASEAFHLGFRAELPREIRFLRSRWKRVLGIK